MSTLNISLPDQLKTWVTQQVGAGRYSSASDYMRDLIREDIREGQKGIEWLANKLRPLLATPQQQFITTNANDIKTRARQKIKD